MLTSSLSRLAAAVGGLALALTGGVGVASANPDMGPAVNTTCSYEQVMAAMNAQSPAAAEEFNATPMAQSFLQSFLASPPAEREQMLQQVAGIPAAAEYIDLITPVANTCRNY